MCCVKPICYANCHIQQLFQFHGSPGDLVFQRHAVEILHGDEQLPVMLADLINRADVRMV